MRNYLCKILSLGLCLIMLIGVIFSVPLTVSAADASGNIYPSTLDGDCGDNAHFYCFPDASMAIFGNGPMYDYELSANSVSTAPWYSQITNMQVTLFVNKIAIEYGVTSIGDYAFYFPDTVTKYKNTGTAENPVYVADDAIDPAETSAYAFYKTIAQLYNVDIAYSVTSIGKYAFYNQKMEHITIPGQVTYIGENAFKKSSLKDIYYMGDPQYLTWDGDSTEFSSRITCHIPTTFGSKITAGTYTALADKKNLTFVADLDNLYAGIPDVNRNIGAYFGSTNSKVFGGAAPFIVVGTFNGVKKSTTYGSTGYVSCIRLGDSYYVLTNPYTGSLNLANVNPTSGRMENYGAAHSDLKLSLKPEYIGPDIVKLIYTLENTSASTDYTGIKLGGTGDIKIGADDKAALEPLMDGDDQVGIYMRSHNTEYDLVETTVGDTTTYTYATFGFAGKNVTFTDKSNEVVTSPNAKFFYGAVGSNETATATGTKSMILMPERIFTQNTEGTNRSVNSGDFNRDLRVDSGLSYYWDGDSGEGITLNHGETKQFAVMFSVYGVNSMKESEYNPSSPDFEEKITAEASSAVSAVEDGKKSADAFHTVYWANEPLTPSVDYTTDASGKITIIPDSASEFNSKILSAQIVKDGETPIYSGILPTKFSGPQHEYDYEFNGWSPTPAALSEGDGDAIYTAQFKEDAKQRLFLGHSLTLRGDIGVNFYLNKEEIERAVSGSTVRVDFSWTVMGKENTQTVTLTVNDKDDKRTVYINGVETTCYVASCSVPAAEMSYNIHATAYYSATSTYHWDKDNYSVRDYGMEIINNPSGYSADLVNLAKEMLNYGARAQIIFDRVDAPLATAGFDYSPTAADVSSDNAGDAFGTAIENDKTNKENKVTEKTDMTAGTADFAMTYRGATVVFLSKTSLRLYYTVDDVGTAPESYTIFDRSASPRGDAEKFFETNGDYVFAEFEDIPAAELDTLQKITVGEHTYYYSVLDYAKILFDYPEAGEHYTAADEKDFARSIYLYNHAANNYFNDFEA